MKDEHSAAGVFGAILLQHGVSPDAGSLILQDVKEQLDVRRRKKAALLWRLCLFCNEGLFTTKARNKKFCNRSCAGAYNGRLPRTHK
ncbi:hypothetical protein LCGC14_2851120 [marine sediment metagenome]|uniref:Uncharacterized protein n=1 Tax=marine sediment metagenome TaxID=412755 RepID=A0A0F8Y8I2_9ZZZZ